VALKYRPVCPQRLPDIDRLEQRLPLTALNHWKRLVPFLEKQQEECLNLNVYVPLRGETILSVLSSVFLVSEKNP